MNAGDDGYSSSSTYSTDEEDTDDDTVPTAATRSDATPLEAWAVASPESAPPPSALAMLLSDCDRGNIVRLQRVAALLAPPHLRALLDCVDEYDEDALAHASSGGHANVMAWLLAQYATPSLAKLRVNRANATGYTVMHLAAESGHAAAVYALLGAGASSSVVTRSGNTPLHLAAKRAHWECCEALIFAGARGSTKNAAGKSARGMIKRKAARAREWQVAKKRAVQRRFVVAFRMANVPRVGASASPGLKRLAWDSSVRVIFSFLFKFLR